MQNQSQELTYSGLTPLQQQRYDYLFPIYGKHAAEIVTSIYGKGKNSWASFLEKMDAIDQAKPHVKEYYDALYDTFQIGKVYQPGQIIGNVNEARRELGLIPYTEKIKIQSEHDFYLLFLVEDSYVSSEDGGTKTFEGYKPIVRIKPVE
jgi:hypothetical protein